MIFRARDLIPMNVYLDGYFKRAGRFPEVDSVKASIYNAKYRTKKSEVVVPDSIDRIRIFRFEDYDFQYSDYYTELHGKLNAKRPIPDILVSDLHQVVSESFLKILYEFDDESWYQTHPTEYRDKKGNPLHEEPFYFLNIRRHLEFDPLDVQYETPFTHLATHKYDLSDRTVRRVGTKEKLPLCNDYDVLFDGEREMVATIQADPKIRERVEKLPLWRVANDISSAKKLFFNEPFFDAIQAAGLTGLNEYTQRYGKRWENVGHV